MSSPRLLAQFGNSSLQPDNARFGVDFSSGSSANAATLTTLESIISQILGIVTVLATIFFIYNFVMGAFKWVTAGGDSGQIGKARDQMVQAVVGLIVLIGAYSVIGLIGTILGIDILSPGDQLQNILTGGGVTF